MAELRIRVSAYSDRSMDTAFESLKAQAERARRSLAESSRRGGAENAAATRQGTSAEEKEFARLARTAERWRREMVRDAERTARAESRAVERAGREQARNYERSEREKTRIAERESAARVRSAEKEQRAASRRASQQEKDFRRAVAGNAGAIAGGVSRGARFAAGIAKDLARGAGIDMDLGSILAKNTHLETAAANVSNQGFIAGDARNGRRVDKRELMNQAFDVGTRTGTNADDVLEGLDAFTTKTGDLQTGRDILEQMAKMAKATGSSLKDMMDASGDVANNLEGVEDKGAAINNVMKAFAGQGKLGAVEIKSLASQMAKVASASNTFEGGEKSMIQMGVMAQMARAKGGAASATQAATSTTSFANVFSKNARLKEFDQFGVSVEGAGGKRKNQRDLLLDMMRAASSEKHGGLKNLDRNMGMMVMDAAARRTTRGWEDIYKTAGGGAKGEQAVLDAWNRLERAVIADAEIVDSFGRAMGTSKSQSEAFNNQIRKSVSQMQETLTPAIMQLANAAVPAAQGLAKVAEWLLGNAQQKQFAQQADQDVDTAITSSKKQIAGGKISTAQLDQNKIAEAQAREALARSQAELEVMQKQELSKNEKTALGFLDASPIGILADKALGGKVGQSVIDSDRNKTEAKRGEMEKHSDQLKRMTDQNGELLRLIKDGIVVKVAEMPTQPGSPPTVDGAGRQDAPGAKPR